MTIDDSHDLHALAALGRPDGLAPALGAGEGGVDEGFPLVDHSALSPFVGQIGEHPAQDFALAPLLEAPMHGLVVRVALRQHVPLGPGIENPQNAFEHLACGHRLATRAAFGNVLLGKMLPDTLPLLIAQPQHETNSERSSSAGQQF